MMWWNIIKWESRPGEGALVLLSVFTVDLQAGKHVFIQDKRQHADVFM